MSVEPPPHRAGFGQVFRIAEIRAPDRRAGQATLPGGFAADAWGIRTEVAGCGVVGIGPAVAV